MKYPRYIESYENGSLKKLADTAWEMLRSCAICPRRCNVNRLNDQKGYCRTGERAVVCSYMAHRGEEPPISASNGSGTIFFSNCNMSCKYCQNFKFSQLNEGRRVEIEELAGFMLELQKQGCHNINLVTPTHVMPQIIKAILLATPKGLSIPICYNTSGYELPDVIKMLEVVVDIYLSDMRYADRQMAEKYSQAPDYPRHNQDSIKLMHRQTGIPTISEDGIIKRGLIIRHLVLPNNISGTEEIARFISSEISKDTYISLMSQYFPCNKADRIKELSRRITLEEYEDAVKIIHKYGLYNGWVQESGGLARFAGTNIKKNI